MYCPYCNSYNDDKGNFCSNCGAPLHAGLTPPNPAYQQPQGNTYQQPRENTYQQPQGNTYQQPQGNTYQQPQGNTYQQPQGNTYQQPQGNTYQQPQGNTYQQPQHGAFRSSNPAPGPEPTKPLSIATPIAALIVNLVFFNVIGLLLAGLSLLHYNNYASEKQFGSIELAETYKQKSKRDAIWAIVVDVICLLVLIALGVVFGLLVFTRGVQAYPGPFNEFFVDPFLWIG